MTFAEPKHILEQLGVSEGMTVADFGAGAGHYSVEAARMVGSSGVVYAIEIQSELLTKANHIASVEERKIIRFVAGDCEVLGGTKLPDASVDVVILSNMLFQCTEKEVVLSEALRILRPKGRALLIDWSQSFGGLGPQPEHVLVREAARTLAEQASFVCEREVDAGDYHYGLVLRKHG